MKLVSTKKLFCYISLSLVLAFFVFVLIAYSGNFLPQLYDLVQVGFYYMVVYVLLSATSYAIDTQTRKEPAFLTLFCFPAYSLVFLLAIMFIANINYHYIIILLLVFVLVYILGYYCYTKWIEKILRINKGYENILLVYVILHLFVVLFIAFKIFGLL